MDNLKDQLIRDEAYRMLAYDDANGKNIVPGSAVVGHPTVGIGRCLDKEGITKSEALYLLDNDIKIKTAEVIQRIPWTVRLDDVRRAAFVNMSFNMGVDGLLKFRNALEFTRVGNYAEAKKAFLDSLWRKQVGARADRLTEQILTGVWQ